MKDLLLLSLFVLIVVVVLGHSCYCGFEMMKMGM